MLIQQDFGTIYGGGELIVGVEKEVGTFTDGNGVTHKRYVKVIDCGTLPSSAGILRVAHGISFTKVLSVYGAATAANGTVIPLPNLYYQSSATTQSYNINLWLDVNNINIEVFTDRSSFAGLVTIEYYK